MITVFITNCSISKACRRTCCQYIRFSKLVGSCQIGYLHSDVQLTIVVQRILLLQICHTNDLAASSCFISACDSDDATRARSRMRFYAVVQH